MFKHCPFAVLLFILFAVSTVSAQESTKKNVLLICVDDLRPELGCYGKEYISSPNIDRLAKSGLVFMRHFVQAPTCGASRFSLLTGQYGRGSNGDLFQRAGRIAKDKDSVTPSMPAWFRKHGYTTVSVGKVSHHPGGRGGKDWDDDSRPEMPLSWDRHLMPSGDWQHPRGAMHGLAHGEIRGNAKEMDVIQSVEGKDDIYPDGLTTNESLKQLELLAADKKPFFLAVGLLRPHLPFGAPAKYMTPYRDAKLPPIPHPDKPAGKTTWHGSGEFMKYNRWKRNPNTDSDFATSVRRHYAACVSYADAQVGRLLKQLDDLKLRKDTIIVLWGDHGWHLGEHAVWGKHTLFDESLHSPLIISYPELASAGKQTDALTETIDIYPTMCDLTGVKVPKTCAGVSLHPVLADPKTKGHPAVAIKGQTNTIRTDTHRLILHRDGYAELYANANETKNVAEQNTEMVKRLTLILKQRLATRDR